MDTVRRFVDKLKKKREARVAAVPLVIRAAETYVDRIPPAPIGVISGDMKKWAHRAKITLGTREGVWWFSGDTLVRAQQGGGRVGLHFHGGSYVRGSVTDVLSGFARIPRGFVERRICSSVLSLEYTLAPKDPDATTTHCFPLQILEALSAYYHLLDTLKIPAHRIVLIGDSAGAHLALALQRYLLESGHLSSPRALLLLSPWCDLAVQADNVKGLLGPLPTQALSGPYFSPALHPPPSHWPPTLVYSGPQENHASSIAEFVAALGDAGAKVKTYEAKHILPRYSHDFLIFGSVDQHWPDEVQQCWTRIQKWLDTLGAA
ncbi:hypothetical protein VTO73DRAFT_230 [Trametes versicolor]